MKTNFNRILTLLLAFVVHISFAQNKTISGTVSDESGLPLPGVNIIVKGSSNGTQTDFDGNYEINVNLGEILVFSYVGYTSKEMIIGGANKINVALEPDVASLEQVVVTAQGIKREKKSLGYAVSTVKKESVEQRTEGDIGRVLSGKVAGVDITASNGLSGSSTNIVIRGNSSATQSNQPLFIVDGVPFDSGTNGQSSFLDNSTESSRFLDLDPNSIESINVLKGLSATVLYGSQGSNGVILITTKNSSSKNTKSKAEVTINQSLFLSSAILPKYQDNYGGGFHQGYGYFFSNWGPRFDRTDNDGVSNATQFTGTGANGNAILRHPFNFIGDQSLVAGFEDLKETPYEYKPYDGVKDFFKTGIVSSTSINLRGGNQEASYNVNYGRLEDEGITPGNKLTRNAFSVGGSARLNNKFSINGVFNFSRTDFLSPPNAASFGSGSGFDGAAVFGDILYTPRSVDLTNIPFQAADGRSLYYRSGNDIQNPYWTVNNAFATQQTDRSFNNLGVSYQLNDSSFLSYRLGLDTYTELNSYGQNKGGVDGESTGIYRTITARNTIWDHNLSWSFDKDISENLNLKLVAGVNARRDTYTQDGLESTGQLAFGTLRHFNFTSVSSVNSFSGQNLAFDSESNQIGLYLDATLGHKDYLFFNFVARNDWYSTLESENNSILYPGGSISFIPTKAFDGFQGDVLNYLKLRAGYGTSARTAPAFNTRNTLGINARDVVRPDGTVISSNSVSNTLGNPNLKPERLAEFEIGIDTRLFNRLNFNVSAYRKTTTDLITDRTLDDATGSNSTLVNVGEIRNEGIEIDYDLDVFKNNDGLKFNIAGNFVASEDTVVELADGTDNIALTSRVTNEAANYLVEGRPYGVLLGTTIQRDDNGNPVVAANGRYIENLTISEIGDPNPDWTTAVIPSISYKGLKFSAQIQYRHGGDIYSTTAATLIGRGVVDLDDPICRECTFILPGVKQDGTPNDVALSSTNLGFQTYLGGPNDLKIFDGSTLRLQEVSLSYSLSKKNLEKTPFGSLIFTLSGSNLWFKAFNFPSNLNYDTNSSSTGVGNGRGIDFITGPSTRRYGFSVKASF